MTAVLELENLGVRFGTRDILSGISCSLQGRTIGLLGPNGAGKSTLINALLGFVPPHAGTARVLGHDIRTDIRKVERWSDSCRRTTRSSAACPASPLSG